MNGYLLRDVDPALLDALRRGDPIDVTTSGSTLLLSDRWVVRPARGVHELCVVIVPPGDVAWTEAFPLRAAVLRPAKRPRVPEADVEAAVRCAVVKGGDTMRTLAGVMAAVGDVAPEGSVRAAALKCCNYDNARGCVVLVSLDGVGTGTEGVDDMSYSALRARAETLQGLLREGRRLLAMGAHEGGGAWEALRADVEGMQARYVKMYSALMATVIEAE